MSQQVVQCRKREPVFRPMLRWNRLKGHFVFVAGTDTQHHVIAELRHFILIPSAFWCDLDCSNFVEADRKRMKEGGGDCQLLFLFDPLLHSLPQFAARCAVSGLLQLYSRVKSLEQRQAAYIAQKDFP